MNKAAWFLTRNESFGIDPASRARPSNGEHPAFPPRIGKQHPYTLDAVCYFPRPLCSTLTRWPPEIHLVQPLCTTDPSSRQEIPGKKSRPCPNLHDPFFLCLDGGVYTSNLPSA